MKSTMAMRFRTLFILSVVVACMVCGANVAALLWPIGVAMMVAPVVVVDRAMVWARS